MNNIPLTNNVLLAQNDHFGGANNGDDDDDINGNNNENQNNNEDDHNQVPDNDEGSMESYDDFKYNNVPEDNSENNHYSEGEEDIDDDSAVLEDNHQDTNDIDQHEEFTGQDRRRSRHSMYQSLLSPNGRNELNGSHWNQLNYHICSILGAMLVAEQAGVRMMKEYFEIEASKSSPQYGFRKGLKLFGDKGY